jgi:hypothetical protein
VPKISALTAATALTDDDLLVLVDAPGGSAATKKITAANAATYFGNGATEIVAALSDETTTLTTGTKLTMRMPYDMTLTEVRASINTVSSSGPVTVDINEAGQSILSTKLTIDQGEKTSTTAAAAAVLSDSFLADDAEITFDVDAAGTGAKGLKVAILGTRGGDAPAPANITFVAEAHTTYASGRTTTTVTKPTGTVDDDYVLLGVLTAANGDPPNPTPPAGFSLIAGPTSVTDGSFGVEMRIYGKLASSEGASWDFTHSSCSSQGFALTYRGVHTGTQIDVTATTNSGTGTTSTATGLTTVTNGAMVIFVGHDYGDTANNLTAPTGTTPTFTERIDTALTYAADGVMTTAGATGNKTMTSNSNSSNPWAAALIALRPA